MIEANGVPINGFTFPGGERQIRLPEGLQLLPTNVIRAAPWSSNDVMDLFLTADALYEVALGTTGRTVLELRYLPYARHDRSCAPGEAFSLRMFATLLNAMRFDSVVLHAPHSPKAAELIEHATVRRLSSLTQENMDSRLCEYDAIVAPDKGAEGEVERLAALVKLPLVRCRKTRDPNTGHLSNPVVIDPLKTHAPRLLIVDDICDGGRTFDLLGAELKRLGADRVDLFVAHGIFSKGRDIPNIDNVFAWHSKPEVVYA